jgi:hypothetical protein
MTKVPRSCRIWWGIWILRILQTGAAEFPVRVKYRVKYVPNRGKGLIIMEGIPRATLRPLNAMKVEPMGRIAPD